MGSGKSSLIGSICRAVNEEAEFPSKVMLTLNHPQEDSHGTMQWMETVVNPKGTVVYQDTRGDQVRGCGQHEEAFQEMLVLTCMLYKEIASMQCLYVIAN